MKNVILIAFLSFALVQSSNATGPKDSPLGVSTAPMDASVINNPKIKMKYGVVVTEVSPNSIAADIGLKKDDVIHEVNGQDILNEQQVSTIISNMKVGADLRIVVTRGNKTRTLGCNIRDHA